LDQWYLTSNTDVNLYYLDENADEFPWETDVVWNAIPPQTGNIEVDQAFLSDISDYGVASVIGLKTSKSGNASSTELVLGSDTRLTNSRTPSSTLAHASTHHTGGSDAVSPFSIGAESIFDASSNTLSGTPVTLTASRARVWTFPCFSATTVTLPTTGVEFGDRIVLRGGSPVTAAITITSTGVSDTIQNTDEQFSYTYLSTGIGPRWIKNLVDNHDASRVNSGTFANARINFAAPPAIGSTTPNSGAFTTLKVNDIGRGANTSIQINANGGLTFIPQYTDTNGRLTSVDANIWRYSANGLTAGFGRNYGRAQSYFLADEFIFGRTANPSTINTGIVVLTRDADHVLAQRLDTNPQTFRIYNTYTSTTNFERGFLRWSSNVLQIGTEKGGTGGSARALEFQTDGVTRVTLGDAGGITVNSGNLVLTDNTGAETATFDAQAKLTANRTYDLPDSSGTIALTAQLTDTQIFTAGGTWTKPAGAKMVHYIVIGGGGGGGSGRCDNAGTDRSGGGGGGAGGITVGWLNASALGATETITVGAGGAGGAAKTTVSHGEAGTSGGVSSIGTVIQTHASGGGGGGTTTSGGGGGGASNSARIYSADGATNAGVNGSSGSRGQPSAIFNAPTGGQGGSGISSANVVSSSAAAANSGHVRTGALVAGGTGGASAAGGNGNSGGMNFVGTGGGGGSPNSSTGAGNAGGNGGLYGGGGGGGSAGAFSEASGAGGNGADGIVVITTYF
jgi:hypothetical protein